MTRVCISAMIAKTTRSDEDEEFALALVLDHLTNRQPSVSQCVRNLNDPPDLILAWEHGARWGVEVTRAYQQVDKIGNAKTVSSESVHRYLQDFGRELEEETRGARRFEYTLYLEGPGPFSLSARTDSGRHWKKLTKRSILQHIEAGSSNELRFPGGRLIPREPGDHLRVIVGQPAAEIAVSASHMLWQVLESKVEDLQCWNGTFSQRWLLILNCYPLVDDPVQVEDTLRLVVRENQALRGFDGGFWSGYPDRTLIPIGLPSAF